jgi:ankyrin repeat protein
MTHEEDEVPSKYTPEQVEQIWADYMIEGARYGDKDEVEEALARNTNVNATDANGRTALHVAAANGYVDIMEILLAAGANTEAPNFSGNTSLHWACLGGHLYAINLLLKHGASPSALNEAEKTPLDYALDNEAVLQIFQNYNSLPQPALRSPERATKAPQVTTCGRGTEKARDQGCCEGKDQSKECEPVSVRDGGENVDNVCNGVKNVHL